MSDTSADHLADRSDDDDPLPRMPRPPRHRPSGDYWPTHRRKRRGARSRRLWERRGGAR